MIIAQTPRLILRHFHILDGDAMDRVHCDPEVMPFGRGVQTAEWVRKWLRGCLEDYHQKWGFGQWAVVEKASRQVIGYCGLTLFDDIDGQGETEIGYRLARAHWGRGYAAEAAAAVRDYAFDILREMSRPSELPKRWAWPSKKRPSSAARPLASMRPTVRPMDEVSSCEWCRADEPDLSHGTGILKKPTVSCEK